MLDKKAYSEARKSSLKCLARATRLQVSYDSVNLTISYRRAIPAVPDSIAMVLIFVTSPAPYLLII